MTITLNGTTGIVNTGSETITGTLTAGSFNGASTFGFKNRVINGAMVIDQRNAGASVTQTSANALYPVDRFAIYGTVSSKFTAQQNAGSVTPPAGFTKYLGITSSAATSLAAGDYYRIYQSIEGLNLFDIAYGTASAVTMTLSFWVRSSLTGTFGGSIYNSSGNRSYPFSYTISSANTWEQKTITFAGDTASAIATDNSTGFLITWGLGVGSTYGSGTANAWAAGNIMTPTGATSVVGTSGATFYITGVQLETGTVATTFDYRPYGTELALCQRYYQTYASNNGGLGIFGRANATSAGVSFPIPMSFAVVMRASPTVTITGSPSYGNASGLTASGQTTTNPNLIFNSSASGDCYVLGFGFTSSSEL